tara:strand:+ start:208 stop:2634 length:2427 start_codon:yes stop_codon:yes gene_type:complete
MEPIKSTFKVTIFKNIHTTETPFYRDVSFVLNRIKDGDSKKLVLNIRKEKDKSKRNELKKNLPSICFSGVFNKRVDSAITEHSGIICLDFDGYEKKKLLLEHKEKLTKDKYVYSVFISPSDKGLKVLVKIPRITESHIKHFNALEKYFDSPYWDKSCKNVSRVCYESFDPLIHINHDSELWDKVLEPEYVEVVRNIDTPTIPITDENKVIDILVKWWTKKHPMVDGQRNQNVFVLAMAFNDYGINKSLASAFLRNYASEDFNLAEITRTIDSAYANSANYGTKYYEDDDKLNSIKGELRRGTSKSEVKKQLKDTGLDDNVIESVISKIEDEGSKQVFWEKDDKGRIKIIHYNFKKFLEDNGFYKFCPEGGRNYVFVKVTNNLIDHTFEKEIKDFILTHLIDLDDLSIYNYFADNVRFFREEFLTLLGTIDIYFMSDTKDTAYLYYQNCAVKITKDLVEPIDYLDLGGYVWKDHIINRNFKICENINCDYRKFISNICDKDNARIKTMESTIGYMMHAYKNLSYCPAVILNDQVISENPEGGTGKGLFMNALTQMKKLVVIDGKAFNFEKSFPYQTVSADTQILCFDDVKKHFDFERLFSVVTEGITLEKKNKDAIKIPFSKSPKIGITTNYAIKGTSNSFARRKWELELHPAYNKSYRPIDEFGKHFFADWSELEWCIFDNYMISCLQIFLSTGLFKSEFVNLNIRQLSGDTSHEFIEWCGLVEGHQKTDKLIIGYRLVMNELYTEFINDYPDYLPKSKLSISRIAFNRWVVAYGNFLTGVPPEQGRDDKGRWIKINEAKLEQQTLDM